MILDDAEGGALMKKDHDEAYALSRTWRRTTISDEVNEALLREHLIKEAYIS